VFSLRELASLVSSWLVGDLKDRDVAFVIRGKDGKDEATFILPDPVVQAILDWMAADGEGKGLLQRIVDSVYDYGEHEQTFHIISMGMKGQGNHSLPLGGAFGARLIYKKMFGKDAK